MRFGSRSSRGPLCQHGVAGSVLLRVRFCARVSISIGRSADDDRARRFCAVWRCMDESHNVSMGGDFGGGEELAAEVGGAWVGFGEPDLGFLAEVGAPGGVVGEEAAAEADEDGGVEGVDGVGRVRRRIRALARWRTREVEKAVLRRREAERGGVREAVRGREAQRGRGGVRGRRGERAREAVQQRGDDVEDRGGGVEDRGGEVEPRRGMAC
ncbi:hypothetical protein Scep_000937 [Stephania cephalantha]|uniref:Uncharacterized protein n=1 Tax=Stephania cephalantha TaxID=152367 RepID=A0AAP0Q778_9MAGN